MLRETLCGALAASFLLVGASTADAQFASPIRFNVHGGAAVPTGDGSDAWGLGFRLGAGLQLRAPFIPVGLRLDGDFDRLGADPDIQVPGEPTVNLTIWSATLNAIVSPMLGPLYFIGGVGFYSSDTDEEGVGAETDFGFNVGAGFAVPVPSLSPFIEARWHRINADGGNFDYIPIVFGIRF